MPRDLPDWHALSSQATVWEITDLGELAVRLGSIDSFDRRGDVLFLEDFESGLQKWAIALGGTGAAVDLSLANSRNGLFALRLVGGSTDPFYAEASHPQSYPVLSLFGLECSFHLPDVIDAISFYLYLYDGTNVTTYEIRYDDTNNLLQYRNSAGGYTTIASAFALSTEADLFHTLKLVVDAPNSNYVRLILDNTVYSLSAIAAQVSAAPVSPYMLTLVHLDSRAGQNDTAYVDDVIITQNEPT